MRILIILISFLTITSHNRVWAATSPETEESSKHPPPTQKESRHVDRLYIKPTLGSIAITSLALTLKTLKEDENLRQQVSKIMLLPMWEDIWENCML